MPEPTKWHISTVSVPEATPRKLERRSVVQRKQSVDNKLGGGFAGRSPKAGPFSRLIRE